MEKDNLHIQGVLPRDTRGRIDWKSLRDDDQSRTQLIESEARVLLASGIDFTSRNLKAAGYSGFLVGIEDYYPGSLSGLKIKLEIMEAPPKPRNFWKNLEVIEQEAREFYLRNNALTQTALTSKRASTLSNAAYLYYPGGLEGLKNKLGIASSQKPHNFWTQERIEQEVLALAGETREFGTRLLLENNRGDLKNAIKKRYPGGMRKLMENLNLNPPKGSHSYWTIEIIEQESLRFIEEEGQLSFGILIGKRDDLRAAILRYYPGGLRALRERLGLQPSVDLAISSDEANLQLERLLEV